MRFIVGYQRSYSDVRIVDFEPEVTIARLAEVIPVDADTVHYRGSCTRPAS